MPIVAILGRRSWSDDESLAYSGPTDAGPSANARPTSQPALARSTPSVVLPGTGRREGAAARATTSTRSPNPVCSSTLALPVATLVAQVSTESSSATARPRAARGGSAELVVRRAFDQRGRVGPDGCRERAGGRQRPQSSAAAPRFPSDLYRNGWPSARFPAVPRALHLTAAQRKAGAQKAPQT